MLLFAIFINDLIADSALSCASVTLDSMLYCMCIGYHLFAIGTFHIRTSGLFTCSIHYFFLSPKHILILRFKTFDFFWINFLNFCGHTSNPSPFRTGLLEKITSIATILTNLAQNVGCLRTFMAKMDRISLSF